MKILLCHPNQKVCLDGIKGQPMVGPPLGLLLIAAQLRASDLPCDIEIYDARLSAAFSVNELGERIFGDSDAEALARICRAKPNIVGISNMFTAQIGRAYALADLVKKALPQVTVVIGGPHVTVFPQEALLHHGVDYVVLGEGEERMTELVRALIEGRTPSIEGVIDKVAALSLPPRPKIGFIADIDRLPLPAYDLVDLDAYFALARRGLSPRYREWGRRAITAITSRGCPHVCSFCSIHATMGYRYRPHSPTYVARHIDHLVSRYGIDFIHFEDDNLTHVPERYDAIVAHLANLRPKVRWDTPNGVRADIWTRDRIRKAKESGCEFLTAAIESAVPRVLDDLIHKRLDLRRAEEMIQWCSDFKLRLHAFYLIGIPGERLDEMERTIDFALDRYWRFGVTPFLQTVIPLPGTPLTRALAKDASYSAGIQAKHNQLATVDFVPGQVRRLYRRYLWKRLGIFALRSIISWRDFLYNVRLVAKYPRAVGRAVRNAVNAGW
jgi:radical SAM superfamily enzyme YgiQ (UPF0313 family)